MGLFLFVSPNYSKHYETYPIQLQLIKQQCLNLKMLIKYGYTFSTILLEIWSLQMFTYSLADLYDYFILPSNFPDCSKKKLNTAKTFRQCLKLKNADKLCKTFQTFA